MVTNRRVAEVLGVRQVRAPHYLCGNHSPETVRIPLEHRQLQARLRTRRYHDSEDSRQMELADTAVLLSEVLGQVPGLAADLSDSWAHQPEMVHLQLVVSASELALLPFELAHAPRGAPGAGQPSALQSRPPLTITRQWRIRSCPGQEESGFSLPPLHPKGWEAYR